MLNNPIYQNKSWSYDNIIQGASGTITVDARTEIIRCDTTAGPVNITLLELSDFWNPGYELVIHDYGTDGTDGNASANPITITVNQIDERINGQNTFVLSENRGSVLIKPVDNKNWIGTGTSTNTGTDFLHAYAVFVDPNGDDTTGEFGNMHKPFNTPYGALLAAVNYINTTGYFIIPAGYSDAYVSDTSGSYGVVKDIFRRIEIHVFPGFYDALTAQASLFPGQDFSDNSLNLMYNYIDWYLHPGAIFYNYIFDDSFNDIDTDVSPAIQGRPVKCNVYGDGTFVRNGYKSDSLLILLENQKTIFNFNAESTNGSFYVTEGNLYCNIKRQFILRNQMGGYHSGIEGGKVNLNIDEIKWILNVSGFSAFSTTFLYQGNGELNANIKKYTAIKVKDKSFYAEEPDVVSTSFYGGYPDPYHWYERNYDIGVEDYAPSFGYFENYDPLISPAKSNIHIDYGKFIGYVFWVEGGDVKFYPGTIEIGTAYVTGGRGDIEGEVRNNVEIRAEGKSSFSGYDYCSLGYFGGPYYEGSVSKFSIFEGKIIYKIYEEQTFDQFAEGMQQYDDSQIYVNDTLFDFEIGFEVIFANTYYQLGGSLGYQDYALILDGPKYYSPPASPSIRYNFYVENSGDPFEIKIYGNCFSNFDPGIWEPTGDSVTNIIPWTTMIIDQNVQII